MTWRHNKVASFAMSEASSLGMMEGDYENRPAGHAANCSGFCLLFGSDQREHCIVRGGSRKERRQLKTVEFAAAGTLNLSSGSPTSCLRSRPSHASETSPKALITRPCRPGCGARRRIHAKCTFHESTCSKRCAADPGPYKYGPAASGGQGGPAA